MQYSKKILRTNQTEKEERKSSKNENIFGEDLSNRIKWYLKWIGPLIVIHRRERQKRTEVGRGYVGVSRWILLDLKLVAAGPLIIVETKDQVCTLF